MTTDRLARSKRWLRAGLAVVALAALAMLTQPLLVEWHLGRARRFLRDRDHPSALKELRWATWLAPKRPEPLLLMARVHRRLGDNARAGPLLRQAEKRGGGPDGIERETLLLLAQTGRLHEAEPRLADLLIDPRDDGPDICAAYVQGYFANLRVAEALQLLDAWQAEYPDDPQAYFMRAYLLQALAYHPEAIAVWRQGLVLAPGETRMRFRLAEALSEAGQPEEAAALFDQCLQELPEDPEIVTAWAGFLFRRGDSNQARGALEGLLQRRPDWFDARRQLGELELTQGRFKEALPHLEIAVRQRPYDATARNALGKALRALGRTEEAKPHFQYVAEAEPSIHRLEQQLREVVQRPKDPKLRYEIGATLLKYGSPDDGAKWLRTVLELQPGHREAHRALAAYYESRRDWTSALAHRRQAGDKQ